MESKFETLRDALLACEVEAEVRSYTTSDGDQQDVAGIIPTNIYAGAGNSHHVGYVSWFLGRGRWLCLESEIIHPVQPASVTTHLPALRQAVGHANATGYWVTQFVQEQNGVVARMATMLPTDRSLEEIVRTLVEDFVQAIDACHYFFAVASQDGVCLPRVLDDPGYVVWLLRWGLAWERHLGSQADPGTHQPPGPVPDGQEEEEEEEEDQDEEAEEDDDGEESEIEIDEPDEDDDEDDSEQGGPGHGSRRLPWE
jgi:hypothetical protein